MVHGARRATGIPLGSHPRGSEPRQYVGLVGRFAPRDAPGPQRSYEVPKLRHVLLRPAVVMASAFGAAVAPARPPEGPIRRLTASIGFVRAAWRPKPVDATPIPISS